MGLCSGVVEPFLLKTNKKFETYNKTKLFVVTGVHGLAFLNAAAVIGFTLHIEGNSPQLKDNVSLSLKNHQKEEQSNTGHKVTQLLESTHLDFK